MLKLLGLIVLSSLLASANAAETSQCVIQEVQALRERPSWSELPKAWAAPLSEEFLHALARNPSVQELKKKYGEGSRLYFRLDGAYDAAVAAGEKAPEVGETLQSVFLEKVLRAIFPKATIGDARTSAWTKRTQPRIVTLKVRDNATDARGKLGLEARRRNGAMDIEMAWIKAANPGPAVPSARELRRVMGLPQDAKIASVYIALLERDSNYIPAIDALLKSGAADGVIVSGGYGNPLAGAAALKMLQERGIRVVTPEELASGSVRLEKPFIVYNNTRGYMPYVHGAADYTVVVGPANIFESLNVGRPTYFMKEKPDRYDPETWKGLQAVATATGGGHGYGDVEELPDLIRQTSREPVARKVWDLTDSSGTSPLDRFIIHLKSAVEAEKN